MANRLKDEISPYLLQHADNPVDWYPWSTEALDTARTEDKPIFLSIGYAACHWCHVMAHESFEDPQTARLMNEYFINIKVDREERPELDQIYMDAVVALTGQGGWPMSIFLTPEGKPFFGGTYFPPARRFNMPAFQEVLASVARAWREDRGSIQTNADKLITHLTDAVGKAAGMQSPDLDMLNQVSLSLAQAYDWQSGGWGRAPKFPQPMLIEFLLHQATRGDRMAQDICEHALQAMARGGMYDLVGGGFSRYSTDNHWLVPHFEKMLYDNAQLARVYLFGYLLTKNTEFRRICEETLDFTLRELTHPQGGFFSSLDADSEGEEGKYYVWTEDQIRELLPHQQADLIIRAFGVTDTGNFEGSNVFQRKRSDEELAQEFMLPVNLVNSELSQAKLRLLQARQERVRPGTDDKVLTGWNGLMLRALAEAAVYLDRSDYLAAAQRNADFILTNLKNTGRLVRAWRDGRASSHGFLEDYAGFVLGLLSLYQVDFNPRWYQSAFRLTEQMIDLFADPEGGFFDTANEHEELVMRPKSIQDNAVPSGNSLAAQALLLIAAYTGNSEYIQRFEQMWGLVADMINRFPTAFGSWLVAADLAVGPVFEIAVLSDEDPAASHHEMLAVYREKYRSRMIIAQSSIAQADLGPPLLLNRPLLKHQPTAYVCQGFACRQPVTDPEEFRTQLESPAIPI